MKKVRELCKDNLKFLIIDQITSEILLNRGDLSKCSLDLDYDIIKKYIPMFEKSKILVKEILYLIKLYT